MSRAAQKMAIHESSFNVEQSSQLIATSQKSHWIESPTWDAFWILSGLWLLGLISLTSILGWSEQTSKSTFYVVLLLWGGHILSPIVTAWSSPVLRELMLNNKAKFILAPAAVLIISVVIGILGDLSQFDSPGWTHFVNPRFLMFTVFLLWNTYHFSAQNFGVLSIYRSRAGQTSLADRNVDRLFTIVIGCVLLPLSWIGGSVLDRLGPFLEFSQFFPKELTGQIVIVMAVLITTIAIAREASSIHRSIPKMLYLLSVGVQPVLSVISYGYFHFFIFTMCHWMIALSLSARIAQGRAIENEHNYSFIPAFSSWNRYHLSHIFLMVVISVPLALTLFFPATFFGEVNLPIHFALVRGQTTSLLGLLSGIFFGITFVHFMYDKFVYSFRNPDVRKAVGTYILRKAN